MSRSLHDDLDRIIGANMRRLRLARGMTQTELGACLPVTFQQIQKYEKGTSSISAVNLVRLAVAMECKFDEFFKVQEGYGALSNFLERANVTSVD